MQKIMKSEETLIKIWAIGVLSWGFLIPIILCILFKYFISISIGPFVLYHFLLSSIVFLFLTIYCLGGLFKSRKGFYIFFIIGSIIAAFLFLIIVMYYFILLTAVFGIMDYSLI